jgi:hypothetical protein
MLVAGAHSEYASARASAGASATGRAAVGASAAQPATPRTVASTNESERGDEFADGRISRSPRSRVGDIAAGPRGRGPPLGGPP